MPLKIGASWADRETVEEVTVRESIA